MEAAGPDRSVDSPMLQLIPPNGLHGLRTAQTSVDRPLLNDPGAVRGRVLVLDAPMVALELLEPPSVRTAVFRAAGGIGFVRIVAADRRTANLWRHQRRRDQL